MERSQMTGTLQSGIFIIFTRQQNPGPLPTWLSQSTEIKKSHHLGRVIADYGV